MSLYTQTQQQDLSESNRHTKRRTEIWLMQREEKGKQQTANICVKPIIVVVVVIVILVVAAVVVVVVVGHDGVSESPKIWRDRAARQTSPREGNPAAARDRPDVSHRGEKHLSKPEA